MLMERDAFLDELDRLAADAAAGAGRVAFVVGEAGIGKTSLLRAFADRLAGRMRCLWAACEDLSAPEALTLLRDLPLDMPGLLDRATDGTSRLAVFADIVSALSAAPTVLIVEDLHWADDGSIDFVRYAGRRIGDRPLLVVISTRNEEEGARSRLNRAANDIPPALRRRFDLPRLSSVAVGAMAAACGLFGAAIHDATGGNPLFVTEMLANRGARSSSIDDLVVGRADRLGPDARAFLDYCSIIPRRVALEQVEASGADDAAIGECLSSGLLLADDEGVAFRHEITRRAVEDALTPLLRRRLHMAELERLDAQGASAARRLHHAVGAQKNDHIRQLAPAAAEQASALGAHREAVKAWSVLLDDSGEQPPDPIHCERYAFELHVTGDLARSIVQQERALVIYRARKDHRKEGDCLRFLSRLHYLNGNRQFAEGAGRAAVSLLEDFPDTPELALAYANLAHLAMLAEDRETTVLWSERAIPIAEGLERNDILATVLNNYGTALQFYDRAAGIAMIDRSIALGTESGSQEHVARAYTNKGWSLLQARRLEEARHGFAQGVDYCIERDLDVWRDYMAGGIALTLVELGRWRDAADIAQPIVADSCNSYLMRNPAVRALTLLRIRRGEQGVEELLGELRDHMVQGRETPRFVGLSLIAAEQAWTGGDRFQAALALLDEAAALILPDGNPWDRAALAYWRGKLGSPVPMSDPVPEPYALFAAGDIQGAAEAFGRLAMPFARAQMLAEGDEGQATEALALLDRLGASATAARFRTELSRKGLRSGARGPRASTRSNRFGLTRRELDVLARMDLGLTNKEIGELLFVSSKTVDHHVSAVLGKLGARTRGEAAAMARDEGLLPPSAVRPPA